MARNKKYDQADKPENRDRTRDRDGWKADRQAARRHKRQRRSFERGWK